MPPGRPQTAVEVGTLQAIRAVARFTDEETESQGLGGTRDTARRRRCQGLSQVSAALPCSCGGPAPVRSQTSGLPS